MQIRVNAESAAFYRSETISGFILSFLFYCIMCANVRSAESGEVMFRTVAVNKYA